jgi:hypothetical protein
VAKHEREHETVCDGKLFERDVACLHFSPLFMLCVFGKTKKSRSYFDIENGSLLSMACHLLAVNNIASEFGKNEIFKKIFHFAIYS